MTFWCAQQYSHITLDCYNLISPSSTAFPLGCNWAWPTWARCGLSADPEVLGSVGCIQSYIKQSQEQNVAKKLFNWLIEIEIEKKKNKVWIWVMDFNWHGNIQYFNCITLWLVWDWPGISCQLCIGLLFAHERQETSVFSVGWAFHSGWISSGLRCVAVGNKCKFTCRLFSLSAVPN